MTQPNRHELLRCFGNIILLVIGLGVLFVGTITAAMSVSTAPPWADPAAKALKRVGPAPQGQRAPVARPNLDCSPLSYRVVNSAAMQTGCVMSSALGMVDTGNKRIIFAGSDEAVPIVGYYTTQALVPWPDASLLLSLNPAPENGAYMGLYRHPSAALRDQRSLGKLVAKQVIAPPDIFLSASTGKRLVVNGQTLAFSDNGSWLAVETHQSSFVRVNLATLEVIPFARAFSNVSAGANQSRVAISSDGRFVAIANKAADSFKVYDLSTCQSGSATELQPQNCTSYDYQPFIKSQVVNLSSIQHLRFIHEGLLSFDVLTTTAANDAAYLLAPTDGIRSYTHYLGLGDSYTSGEGAFNYLSGTDTADNMCHLSARSYPILLTQDLFSSSGGHSVACSGAVINDVVSSSADYRGQVRGVPSFKELQTTNPGLLASVLTDFLPGYVAQQRFVRHYQPLVTTVSVGGNDIGFGSILEQCVIPKLSLDRQGNSCFRSYEDRLELTQLIDRTKPKWVALYRKLLSSAPETKLYAIGYPQVAVAGGNCALNVHLDTSELLFVEQLINYLNSTVQQAAAEAGVSYVDISQALAGHRLCETASHNVAMNGLTAGTDGRILGIGVLGKESYHPNALGHQLIKQAILGQTGNLRPDFSYPTATTTPNVSELLAAPKTGRLVAVRLPQRTMVPAIATHETAFTVQLDGEATGLRPQTTYAVRLDGMSGTIIGTSVTDNIGNLSLDIALDATVPAGGHTIDVIGNNQADQLIDATQPIYLAPTTQSSDGDPLADDRDTCLDGYGNSQGGDNDTDCDPLVSQMTADSLPPATPTIVAQLNQTSASAMPIDVLQPASVTLALSTTQSPNIRQDEQTTRSALPEPRANNTLPKNHAETPILQPTSDTTRWPTELTYLWSGWLSLLLAERAVSLIMLRQRLHALW